MYKEISPIFITTSFSESGRERAQLIKEFLELFELQSVLGETFGGTEVSQGVRARLESAFFLIAILSREAQLSDGTWRTSEWLIQEIAWAKACKKDCLILVEEHVQVTSGILGDVELLTFNANNFGDVLVPAGRQVRALLNRRLLTTGIKEMPIHTYVSDEPLRNECTDEAKLLILEVRHLARQQRYEEALEAARKAIQADSNCWRAWTSLGALLVQLGKVDEGDNVFSQVLNDFSNDDKARATVLHNRAWVLEIRCGLAPSISALREQTRLYEQSLRRDESRVNTRACLLICRLLLDETEKAEKLLESSLMYEGFLDALRFELDTRGATAHKALQALPKWLRNLLYPIRRNPSGGDY